MKSDFMVERDQRIPIEKPSGLLNRNWILSDVFMTVANNNDLIVMPRGTRKDESCKVQQFNMFLLRLR